MKPSFLYISIFFSQTNLLLTHPVALPGSEEKKAKKALWKEFKEKVLFIRVLLKKMWHTNKANDIRLSPQTEQDTQ